MMVTQQALAVFDKGRDNNFNLIRFVASLSVVITHAIALSTGNTFYGPLHHFGSFVAIIAPDVFFVASGYLITASLLVRGQARNFVVARVLRIYPALWLTVLTVAFVVGPWVTTLPLADYFAQPLLWSYLAHNLTVLFGASEGLPGVFTHLPYPNAVNGSLWTLPYEVRLYVALLIGWWLVGKLAADRLRMLAAVIVSLALLTLAAKLATHFYFGQERNMLRLAPPFFIGSAFYLFRDRIALRRGYFVAALTLMLLASPWLQAFYVVDQFCIAYLTLYLAYVPGGVIRRFNRIGDCSYGIYIYSFPLQQLLVMSMPGIGPWSLMAWSVGVALPLSLLSWHFLEKPALALLRKSRAPAVKPALAVPT